VTDRKDRIRALLKGIETGDPESVTVVSTETYIQHNPQTRDGSAGLAELFKRLSERSPRVAVVRAFEEGDFVFAHTEYDFGSPRVGFEVFRFEGDVVVEHWDNIQPRRGPNRSGRTMTDGPVEASGAGMTEANRSTVAGFVDEVLIGRRAERHETFVDVAAYAEHDPDLGDDDGGPLADPARRYDRNHRLLADGAFVLSACEGERDGLPTAFYDLFRLAGGQIVEHWNTIETIPPRAEWKNDNGKF